VKSNSGNLVQTGYTFVGWNTASNGSGASYAGGAILTIGTSNVTLFAQWTAVNQTYSVSYNGNTNTGGSAPIDGNNYLSGATVTVRNMGTLVKTGCAFAGWNTSADGSGTPYNPGDTFVMGAFNVTLYAQWVVTITATAGANGSISPSGVATVIAGTNKTYTITPNPNYHVAGVVVNGSPVDSVSTYTFTNVSANNSISASFAVNPYSITYNGNGNTGGTVPVDPNLYNSGQTAIVLDNTGGLSNGVLTFNGWNTASDSSGTTYAAGQGLLITGNVTLYAKWH
jgi:uncharacterized repeat protein (TIGR02543 family)